MVMGLLGVASSAASLVAAKGASPPTAEIPAVGEPVSKAPGATVRMGNKEAENTDSNSPDDVNPFVYKRVAAPTIGGVGTAASARNSI